MRCTTCGAHLFGGAPITGYAYRFPEDGTLSVTRLYCETCDRQHIEFPTLGAHEVQFVGYLGDDISGFVLVDVRVLEYSSPSEAAPTPVR